MAQASGREVAPASANASGVPQANDYTVEITQQPGLEAAVDTMSLRLLTRQRAHQRFQTYAPPRPSPEQGAHAPRTLGAPACFLAGPA